MLDEREESNAVVVCIMDTSGSMDRLKKYLARSFFFLLYQFLCTKYKAVEIVFIAHHTQAKEVTEEEFFHKGESGGTLISSGYKKALEIIQQRYHPDHWNIYAFHCSDGDNFESDNDEAMKAARELCEICNLFGYGEIKPMGSHYYESSMLERFRRLDDRELPVRADRAARGHLALVQGVPVARRRHGRIAGGSVTSAESGPGPGRDHKGQHDRDDERVQPPG